MIGVAIFLAALNAPAETRRGNYADGYADGYDDGVADCEDGVAD